MEQSEIVSKIEGIGPVYGNRLARVGVRTLSDLRQMDVHGAQKRTGITIKRLTMWQAMAILQEIQGIDHQISEVLVKGGITDVQKLSEADPDKILKMIRNAREPRDEYNIIPDDYDRVITLADVKEWQNEAKRITHESALLQAAISKPAIIKRAEWGARDSKVEYKSHSPYQITIHHTATPQNGASRVKSIQDYHMDKNGWIDIGYHYLIDSQPRIYEGRPVDVIGAHVKGYNTGNIGIAVIGNYENEDITQTQQEAIEDLGAWLCSTYSISTARIYGHRDFTSTVCPGKYLYGRLPLIRSNIESRLAKPEPEPEKAEPKGKGCFIATAAYGSSLAPEVQFLRDFRDKVLRKTRWGREFFDDYWRYYYQISREVADKMNQDEILKSLLRWSIVTPLINYLKLVVKRPKWNLDKLEPELRMFLEEMKKDMDTWLSTIDVPETFENLDNQSIIDELNIALDFVLKENGESYLNKLIATKWLPLKYNPCEEENLLQILLNSGRPAKEIDMILYGERGEHLAKRMIGDLDKCPD